MEELYRFLLLRPAEALDPIVDSDQIINLTLTDRFQISLQKAESQEDRKELAEIFIASDNFIDSGKPTQNMDVLQLIADNFLGSSISLSLPFEEVLSKTVEILQEDNSL